MVRVGRDTRCVPSLIKVRVESNLVKVRLDTDRLQDAHAAYQRKAEQPKEGNPSHTSRLLPRKSRSMVAVSTCKRPTPPNACALGEAHRFLVPLESSQSNRGSRQKKSLHKHKHGRQGRSTRRWAGRLIALIPNPHAQARPGAETQTLLAQMEEYLSGAKFNKALGECKMRAHVRRPLE